MSCLSVMHMFCLLAMIFTSAVLEEWQQGEGYSFFLFLFV